MNKAIHPAQFPSYGFFGYAAQLHSADVDQGASRVEALPAAQHFLVTGSKRASGFQTRCEVPAMGSVREAAEVVEPKASAPAAPAVPDVPGTPKHSVTTPWTCRGWVGLASVGRRKAATFSVTRCCHQSCGNDAMQRTCRYSGAARAKEGYAAMHSKFAAVQYIRVTFTVNPIDMSWVYVDRLDDELAYPPEDPSTASKA